VLQTLVAEVYGPDYRQQVATAARLLDLFRATPGVVDVDWYMEAEQPKLIMRIDHRKAALSGISADEIASVVSVSQDGVDVGLLHDPQEKEDVFIHVRLPLAQRANIEDLLLVPVAGSSGTRVPLVELVDVVATTGERSIYHKNLLRVVYVTGDMAGTEESPVYAILPLTPVLKALVPPGAADGQPLQVYFTHQPFTTEDFAVKWDGEWHITYEVFRDLGVAFAVVLVLIYILVVGWFHSFRTPFIIMAAIPFSLVGILPAHWVLGAFFTATSMIGFIAGAGIVVRNSIILVDFAELRIRQGMPLADAVIDAGAIRFRPMLLTAAAVVVGASVILFDPIFQGLAISLMAGEIASLLLSRVAVPVLYFLSRRSSRAAPSGVDAGSATVADRGRGLPARAREDD
jgi:multidrug efflux pump subunit AcrB